VRPVLIALREAAAAYEVVVPDGRRVAVFPVEGGFHVVDALCPHGGAPLAGGRIRGGRVHCPWHWYAFDLGTGACRTAAQYRLGVHPVVERDGRWYADVGERPPARSWAERLRAHVRGEA
jgi:nitrite reductase/ring-hydroxylating ferredoxin subunit